jgi:hypothetical protein
MPDSEIVHGILVSKKISRIIQPFRGALRELYLKYTLPGLDNVLTTLAIINRAGHGIRVR